MKEEIISHLNDPRQLEKMYRSDRMHFKRVFSSIYPQLKGNTIADIWNERLNYESDEISWGAGRDLLWVITACLLAGILAKLPAFLPVTEEFYYPRNAGFIIFPLLTAYFAWKNTISSGKIAFIAGTTIAGLIFINALPRVSESDTLILSSLHLILFLWSILGFAFVGEYRNNHEKRLDYLKFNGDLVVITTLIVIAAGILSGITIGLFSLIGLDIRNFYFENIVLFGLPAAPLLGAYLTQTNPQLVGRVSPVIARIFSPLVLVMLLIYLAAMAYFGKDPYNDREFLLVFNALLIGVMAIIFFSVAEASQSKTILEVWILALLSIVTILVNGIALSAILFRISQWGLSPNRAAVLGGNVLILVNLLLVAAQLFKVLRRKTNLSGVGKVISQYLPVYFIWAAIVTFIFPLVFGFK